MRPQLKAALWVGATFVAGTAFGMVLNGALAQRATTTVLLPTNAVIPNAGMPPAPNGGEPQGPAGFVAEMERVIQPRDDAQRVQLRPFFEKTDLANRAIIDGTRSSMRAALDSLRAAINPLLDDAQRTRLRDFGGPPRGESAPGMDGRGVPGDGPGRGRGGRGADGMRGGGPPR